MSAPDFNSMSVRADTVAVKTYTEAEVKALIAAELQRAVDALVRHANALDPAGGPDRDYDQGKIDGLRQGCEIILALIPADHAAALEAVKAQAREEAARVAVGTLQTMPTCSIGTAQDKVAAAIRAGKVQP